MWKKVNNFLITSVIPFAILVGALAIKLAEPAPLQRLQFILFDTFNKLHPRQFDPNTPVRIIDLDEASLEKIGQWPWPRDVLAQLLINAFENGAAVVGFDVVFAEPDGKSLDVALATAPQEVKDALANDGIKDLPNNDVIFADIIKQVPVVLGFSFITLEENGKIPNLPVGIAYAGDDPKLFLPPFPGATPNLPVLENVASGVGSFSVIPELDGVIRRVPILFSYQNELYPSLAAETLRAAQGAGQSIRVKSSGASGEFSFGEQTGILKAKVGQGEVLTDSQGRILLYDTGFKRERYIPAHKFLDGTITQEEVAGKIFLVGTSAVGLQDIRATPLEGTVPGVEVHAQLMEQMISGVYLQRPDWSPAAEAAYLVVFGLIMIILTGRVGTLTQFLIGVLVVGGSFAGSWFAFTGDLALWLGFGEGQQFQFDPLFPSLTALAIFMIGSIIAYARSEAQKREVRGQFSRYLNPALVEQLASDPSKMVLGGEMREMTLMFCDIRGFTPISEQFDPPGLTKFINGFLTPMTDIIMANLGTIDKYMGDCIMAFWNAPLDVPDHAYQACKSALEMIARLKILNEQIKEDAARENRKFLPINIGIGLNSGDCCCGNMGSTQRFDYSVLGDNVNLASRLEGQSKGYHVTIVIGYNTMVKVPQVATLELDSIKVKGKTIPVQIYTLVGLEDVAQTDHFKMVRQKHEQMILDYRAQKWDEVEKACHELPALTKQYGIDGLYELYIERLEEFRANPPGEDWDGVFTATSK